MATAVVTVNMSRKTPPARPVIVASMMTPTISDPCSMALNAPVTANAIVPNRSRICINSGSVKLSDKIITITF